MWDLGEGALSQVDLEASTGGCLLAVSSRMGSASPDHTLPLSPLHTPMPSGSCDGVGTEDKLQTVAGGKKCRRSGLRTGYSGSIEA